MGRTAHATVGVGRKTKKGFCGGHGTVIEHRWQEKPEAGLVRVEWSKERQGDGEEAYQQYGVLKCQPTPNVLYTNVKKSQMRAAGFCPLFSSF